MKSLSSSFPPHAFVFKGGGGRSAPAPMPAAAALPAKPPAATPPVTERTVEVQEAGRQARMDASKRKGQRSTLLAGNTGGYNPMGGASDEKKSLLG